MAIEMTIELIKKNKMKIIKIMGLENMVGGVKFAALVTNGTKSRTGFGITKEEAVEKAKANLNRHKK